MNIKSYIPEPRQENALAEIRAIAMKDSLMAVGRYDEINVRNRLLDNYEREKTKVISVDDYDAGFYSIEKRENVCFLKHLYLLPKFQGKGIGKIILNQIMNEFAGLNIRLNALRGSPANNFYKANGFHEIDQTEFDIIYEYKLTKIPNKQR